MKKILIVLTLMFMVIACSSDDNENDGRIEPTTENIIGFWVDKTRKEHNLYQFIDSKNGKLGFYTDESSFLNTNFTYTISNYSITYINKSTGIPTTTNFYFKDTFLYIGDSKYEKITVD